MVSLLAKSGEDAPNLAQHTRDVMDAAETLFGGSTQSRLGECWLRFFKVDQSQWPIFRSTLRISAACHDLGKANDGFQKAVLRQGKQAIRHEHLSGLLMFHPPVWSWLQAMQGIDWDIALSAVLSHHLKVTEKSVAALLQTGSNWAVKLPACDDPDFKSVLRQVRDADWPAIPVVWSYDSISGSQDIPEAKRMLVDYLEKLDEEFGGNAERTRLLRAVCAALITADAAASGLRREGHTIRQWIEERFVATELCDGNYIRTEIIERRHQAAWGQVERVAFFSVRRWRTKRANADAGALWVRQDLGCMEMDREAGNAPAGQASHLSLPHPSHGNRRLSRLRVLGTRRESRSRHCELRIGWHVREPCGRTIQDGFHR